mgnify:CR=1 FL=1
MLTTYSHTRMRTHTHTYAGLYAPCFFRAELQLVAQSLHHGPAALNARHLLRANV